MVITRLQKLGVVLVILQKLSLISSLICDIKDTLVAQSSATTVSQRLLLEGLQRFRTSDESGFLRTLLPTLSPSGWDQGYLDVVA